MFQEAQSREPSECACVHAHAVALSPLARGCSGARLQVLSCPSARRPQPAASGCQSPGESATVPPALGPVSWAAWIQWPAKSSTQAWALISAQTIPKGPTVICTPEASRMRRWAFGAVLIVDLLLGGGLWLEGVTRRASLSPLYAPPLVSASCPPCPSAGPSCLGTSQLWTNLYAG